MTRGAPLSSLQNAKLRDWDSRQKYLTFVFTQNSILLAKVIVLEESYLDLSREEFTQSYKLPKSPAPMSPESALAFHLVLFWASTQKHMRYPNLASSAQQGTLMSLFFPAFLVELKSQVQFCFFLLPFPQV